MRKISETIAASTGPAQETGIHLVETAQGLEFLSVISFQDDWVQTGDGRLFPKASAHYVFAVVHLTAEEVQGETQEKGDIIDGHSTDQD